MKKKKLTKKQRQEKIREYLNSAWYTFLATFIVVILSQIESLTAGNITASAIWAVVIAAVRAALKAVKEFALPLLNGYLKK